MLRLGDDGGLFNEIVAEGLKRGCRKDEGIDAARIVLVRRTIKLFCRITHRMNLWLGGMKHLDLLRGRARLRRARRQTEGCTTIAGVAVELEGLRSLATAPSMSRIGRVFTFLLLSRARA